MLVIARLIHTRSRVSIHSVHGRRLESTPAKLKRLPSHRTTKFKQSWKATRDRRREKTVFVFSRNNSNTPTQYAVRVCATPERARCLKNKDVVSPQHRRMSAESSAVLVQKTSSNSSNNNSSSRRSSSSSNNNSSSAPVILIAQLLRHICACCNVCVCALSVVLKQS